MLISKIPRLVKSPIRNTLVVRVVTRGEFQTGVLIKTLEKMNNRMISDPMLYVFVAEEESESEFYGIALDNDNPSKDYAFLHLMIMIMICIALFILRNTRSDRS